MDTFTDFKQSRLQKDGSSDVTSFDVSVKLTDTGWNCYLRTVALLMCEYKSKARSQSAYTSESRHGNCWGSRKGYELPSTATPRLEEK